MAKKDEILNSLDELGGSGVVNLNTDRVKKKVLKRKLEVSYNGSVDESEIDSMVEDIFSSRRGEIMNKLDSELPMISGIINSVTSIVPDLVTQISSVASELVSTSPSGPTVPNPANIKNTISRIKIHSESLGSLLSVALGKVVELDISDEIPSSVLSCIDIIKSIKNFPV